MKNNDTNFKFLSAIIYVAFLVVMCVIIANKENLHVDDFYSYGLSNQIYTDHIGLSPDEWKVYTPPESAWHDYLTVQEGECFRYGNVWKNQEEDVHPPLFYVILHTICSFFPNRFSIWYAAIINIAFAVLTLFIARIILRELCGSNRVILLFSVAFSLSAGILSAVSLLRMYLMTMFWVSLISLLFIRIYKYGGSAKRFLSVFAVCAAGTLTHYYFVVWLLFLSLVMGVNLLYRKKWKEILAFICSVGTAGIVAVAVFPGMIYHIFLEKGDRGEESVQKLLYIQKAEYMERLTDYYVYLDQQLFGDFLPFLVLLAAVLLLFFLIRKEKITDGKIFPWFLLGIPCICYYILVARMCVFTTERYIQPIYPIVLCVGTGAVLILLEKLLKNKTVFSIVSGILLLFVSANGLRICPWEYLYREEGKLIKELAAYSDCDCLYVYDAHDPTVRIQQSLFEVRQYRSVVFVADADLEMLGNLSLENQKNLILCVDYACDKESVLELVKAAAPGLTSVIELGKAGMYTTTWYLGE